MFTYFTDRQAAFTISLLLLSPDKSWVHGFAWQLLAHRAVSTLLCMSSSLLFSFTHWVPLLFPSSQPLLLPIPVQNYIRLQLQTVEGNQALPSKTCSQFLHIDFFSFFWQLWVNNFTRTCSFRTLQNELCTEFTSCWENGWNVQALNKLSIKWKFKWTAPPNHTRRGCLLKSVYGLSRC